MALATPQIVVDARAKPWKEPLLAMGFLLFLVGMRHTRDDTSLFRPMISLVPVFAKFFENGEGPSKGMSSAKRCASIRRMTTMTIGAACTTCLPSPHRPPKLR